MSKRFIITAVLAFVMLLGLAVPAFAATDNILIRASVNSKITVTTGADYDFDVQSVSGTGFEPDEANPAAYVAPVNVRSNVAYTMARSFTSDTFPAGMLSINLPADMDGVVVNPKAPSAAGFDWAQTYTLDLRPGGDWTDPGSYSADILYTAVP